MQCHQKWESEVSVSWCWAFLHSLWCEVQSFAMKLLEQAGAFLAAMRCVFDKDCDLKTACGQNVSSIEGLADREAEDLGLVELKVCKLQEEI